MSPIQGIEKTQKLISLLKNFNFLFSFFVFMHLYTKKHILMKKKCFEFFSLFCLIHHPTASLLLGPGVKKIFFIIFLAFLCIYTLFYFFAYTRSRDKKKKIFQFLTFLCIRTSKNMSLCKQFF